MCLVPTVPLPSVCPQVPGTGPAVHIPGLTAPTLRLHPWPGPQAAALLPQLHRNHAQRGRGREAGHPGVADIWFIPVSSPENSCVLFPDLPLGSSAPSSQGLIFISSWGLDEGHCQTRALVSAVYRERGGGS